MGRLQPALACGARRLGISVTVAGVALGLTACAPEVGPRPQMQSLASFQSAQSLQAPAAQWPADQWWRAFGDPQLDALIDEALRGAPTLAIAAARVRLADAQVTEAGGALTPDVGFGAFAGADRETLNTGVDPAFHPFLSRGWHSKASGAFSLNYALDFFGKNRAALAAATSEAEAVRAEQAAARMQIASMVAESYAELLRLYSERQASADALRIRSDSAGLVARRRKDGLENSGRSAQAAAAEASARVDLAAADRAIVLTRNRLAALLGAGPDRGLAIVPPTGAKPLPFGVPADAAVGLIGRRPDVVAARLRTEAAAKRIKVERAAFYPDVSLTALIGLKSIPLDKLFEDKSIYGHAGPALSLPLFKSSGSLKAAAARYDESVAIYDRTLVLALKDVADALADERALTEALALAQEAQASSEEAYRIARLRYTGGLSSYLDVLTIETDMLAQRRRVANLQATRMTMDIALVRALGGGFQAGGDTNKDTNVSGAL